MTDREKLMEIAAGALLVYRDLRHHARHGSNLSLPATGRTIAGHARRLENLGAALDAQIERARIRLRQEDPT
jgi:hypothetical protein